MTTMDRDGSADDQRRAELATFLRARRSQVLPEAVGLPERRRPRTPGLRREDVAERAGMSVAWYTYLEQARPISPSRAMVAGIADALQLTPADRTYLFSLTGHISPTSPRGGSTDLEALQALVDRLDCPAYCTDYSTNVVAWNTAAAEIFGDYGQWPPEHRNLLWLLFNESEFAARLSEREEYAARVVGTFRHRSDAHHTDPGVRSMVSNLRAHSETFRALWDRATTRRTGTDSLKVIHENGALTFTMVALQDVTLSGLRFTAYLPADRHTAETFHIATS